MKAQEEWGSGVLAAVEEHSKRLAELTTVKPCDNCGAPIVFVSTYYGKSIPFDSTKLDSQPREFIIGPGEKVSVTPAVAKHRCDAPTAKTYYRLNDILVDFPELVSIHEETRDAVRGSVYDVKRHAAAKQAWADALRDNGIDFQPGRAVLGFGADRHTPDQNEVMDPSSPPEVSDE